jgi:Zn finger protein HypA/HybF involved in hydrogenase expression
MDRHLKCQHCDWSGHHSEADRAGMDRACPECGEATRVQRGGAGE